MKGVILDQDTLAEGDLDMSGLFAQLDDWAIYPTTSQHEIAERIDGADVVFSNKVAISAEVISQAKYLKLIVAMATGTDHIDVMAANQRGVSVCNARNYSTASVAQHTLTLILALNTRVIDYQSAVAEGAWQSNHFFCLLDYPIVELAGKTLGLIGYGNLAKKVEAMAMAFDMNVIVAESSRANKNCCSRARVPLTQLLSESDIVSLHCPLTDQTNDLLNKDTFSLMKPTAFLVNTARGGVVNEADLVYALKQGQIAGAAVDVLSHEPPNTESVLLQKGIPNLIVTPHCAWASRESRQRLVDQLRDITAGFKSGQLINQVK